jgi:hypothetical protein
MATMFTGGCMCGAVRYECSADPVMSANCYCRDCQRSSGGALASVLVLPKAAFKLTKGTLKYYEVTAESGSKMNRGFCSNCGAPISTLLAGMPDMVAVKAGSLDDPSRFHPTMSIYMSSAPPWAPVAAELTKFPKMPTG